MPACVRRAADLVDGRDHRPAHGERRVTSVGALEGCGGAREEGAAPSAVAPRCAEAGDLLLEYDDPERGIALLQVPGGPQSRSGRRRRWRHRHPCLPRAAPAARATPREASRARRRGPGSVAHRGAPAATMRAIAAMPSGPMRQQPPISVAPSAAHSRTRSSGRLRGAGPGAARAVPHLAAVRVGERSAGRRPSRAIARAPETSLASQQFTPIADDSRRRAGDRERLGQRFAGAQSAVAHRDADPGGHADARRARRPAPRPRRAG